MATAGRKPGKQKTGGRVAGTPNKLTATVKENVINVFNRIGGQEAMAEWAQDNRTDFYRLYARLLPTQVKSEQIKSPVASHNPFQHLSDEELRDIIRKTEKEQAEELLTNREPIQVPPGKSHRGH